ncbi:MAG: DUF3662 and FHA domain-containing protein [Limnochordia bacterium]
MRILDRIESLLENVIEGKNRKGHPQIQPVQIGKKLAKTMEANRRVSIAKTYVPNIYVIRLHPSQLQGLESLQQTLITELKGFLLEKAEEKNLSFIGRLELSFAASPDLEPGSVDITAAFLEAGPLSTAEYSALEQGSSGTERTQVFTLQEVGRGQPVLVIQGKEPQSAYRISSGRQSIGRSLKCDLVIDDPSASRIHAWLEPIDGKWRLIDNNSTNGTFINEQRIDERVLDDGDQIRIGTIIMVFQAGDR